MSWTLIKLALAASIISFCSWLAGKKPGLAGLLLALPLSSLLALAFSYAEYKDPAKSVAFAQSIFLGVPVSLLFFVPFLFADRLRLPFPVLYGLGLVLLTLGFFLHRWWFGADL